MAIPHNRDVSSIEGIQKTIISDKYVARWFSYLIHQPSIYERLVKDEENRSTFHLLKITERFQWVELALIPMFVIAYLQVRNPFFLVPLAITLYFLFHNVQKQRREISKIGVKFINAEFDDPTIRRDTLYQISEHLSQKYHIISVVDAIYRLDKIYRMALLLSFLTFCYVITFDLWWERYVVITIVFFAICVFVNLPVIYKRLK